MNEIKEEELDQYFDFPSIEEQDKHNKLTELGEENV